MDRRTLLSGLAAATLLPALRARAAAPVRVLAFGDSLTAGYGLAADEGFIPALARYVADQGRTATFANAGLSGDTTYGGRVRIGRALRNQRPDAVMVELGANDMLLRMDASRSARNLDAIIGAAKAGGRPVLLLGVHAAGTDRAFRRTWDAMWPAVARRNDVPLVPDLYAGIRAQAVEDRPAFLQADRLHANPRGVATMVAEAGPAVLDLIDAAAARKAA